MALPKWKKHKKRLPSTIPFMKHLIARLAEVEYTITIELWPITVKVIGNFVRLFMLLLLNYYHEEYVKVGVVTFLKRNRRRTSGLY